MPLTNAGQRDPSMLGAKKYARVPLDHYPTPNKAVKSFLDLLGDDLVGYKFWEPFCGTGAFSIPVSEITQQSLSTDLRAYDGFDPDGLFNFFHIELDDASRQRAEDDFDKRVAKAYKKPTDKLTPKDVRVLSRVGHPFVTMQDIIKLKGFTPDCIITIPPYGDEAEEAARHALKLMEPQQGLVAFLCRHEWDATKSRSDLFDHPAFAMKITLRYRPRWIAGSSGAPRFPYSYFVWNWAKPSAAKPELFYVS